MIGLQRQNVWHQLWVKPIENKKKYALSKAAIVMANGKLVAASNNFYLDPTEINEIKKQFDNYDKLASYMDSASPAALPLWLLSGGQLHIKDTTYVVKVECCTSNMLVAFSGHKYIIVTRSAKKTLIVAKCTSRAKWQAAAKWLLNGHTVLLSQNNY